MYSSLDRIDGLAEIDGATCAVQTDHRRPDEVLAEPEISVLFALTRIHAPARYLASTGQGNVRIRYAALYDPPPLLVEAIAAAGGQIELQRDPPEIVELGPGSTSAMETLADKAFAELASRVLARLGTSDVFSAIEQLEAQTLSTLPDRDVDEIGYFTRILELAALGGELLRARTGGRWQVSAQPRIPFGFATEHASGLVAFPTERAQRLIDEGARISQTALLDLVDDSTAPRRVMPSLRSRAQVPLDQLVWKPLLDTDNPDLPVVIYGEDTPSTFGPLSRDSVSQSLEALAAEALQNLQAEPVTVEEVKPGLLVVSGGFFAAEKLLDPDFMRTLHQQLQSPLLAAATPERGALYVASATGPHAGVLLGMARITFEKAGSAGISPTVMAVQEGAVVGHITAGPPQG